MRETVDQRQGEEETRNRKALQGDREEAVENEKTGREESQEKPGESTKEVDEKEVKKVVR